MGWVSSKHEQEPKDQPRGTPSRMMRLNSFPQSTCLLTHLPAYQCHAMACHPRTPRHSRRRSSWQQAICAPRVWLLLHRAETGRPPAKDQHTQNSRPCVPVYIQLPGASQYRRRRRRRRRYRSPRRIHSTTAIVALASTHSTRGWGESHPQTSWRALCCVPMITWAVMSDLSSVSLPRTHASHKSKQGNFSVIQASVRRMARRWRTDHADLAGPGACFACVRAVHREAPTELPCRARAATCRGQSQVSCAL